MQPDELRSWGVHGQVAWGEVPRSRVDVQCFHHRTLLSETERMRNRVDCSRQVRKVAMSVLVAMFVWMVLMSARMAMTSARNALTAVARVPWLEFSAACVAT